MSPITQGELLTQKEEPPYATGPPLRKKRQMEGADVPNYVEAERLHSGG